MKKYFTYILDCSNGKYYVGHTSNLKDRLERHQKKQGAKFTAQNRPKELVWFQEFGSEVKAVEREKQIKGWSREKKEKLVKGTWR